MDSPEQDEEIRKIQVAIAAGMTATATHLQTYLKTWDKYREIWEINKDLYIKDYNRHSPPGTFDKDINGYNAVHMEKSNKLFSATYLMINFIWWSGSLVGTKKRQALSCRRRRWLMYGLSY